MKNKKSFLLSCILVVLFLSTSSYIFADSDSNPVRNSQFLNGTNRELFFGPSILGLEGTGLLTSKSAEGAVPLNRTALAGGRQETIHFSLDISKTSLNTIRSKDYVRIEGLKPYGNPGEPQLPFQSFIIVLPLNSEVSGVSVSDVSYRPIFNKLDIVAHPMPVGRTMISRATNNKDEKQTKSPTGKQIINEGQTASGNKSYSKCKTCDLESFFPGNTVSYYTGKDNNNRYVFIKFFPMQYIPTSKQAILITNADITINYQLTDIGRTGEE